jgi:hypothetical protein
VDLLEYDRNEQLSVKQKSQRRTWIHIGFAVLMWLVIIVFDLLNQRAIIDTILMIAGYTYGPLLALFTLGLFTKISLNDRLVPVVCILAPVVTYLLANYIIAPYTTYQVGNELIVINALVTAAGLLLVRQKQHVALSS